MLTLLIAVSAVLILLFILGMPLGSLLTSKLPQTGSRGPLTVAVSVVAGFAILSVAASWSYGLIGANSFAFLLTGFFAAAFTVYISKRGRSSVIVFREFGRFDFSLLALLPLMLVTTTPYWDGFFKLRLASGVGPDTAQNLMVVSSTSLNQSTWARSRDYFFNLMDTNSLWDGLYHLYQMPSFVEQAAIDYLVYGTRWGLSIPFSQLLRIDKGIIAYEQGLVLGVSLVSIGLLIYGTLIYLIGKPTQAIICALIAMSSTPLLFQFYNGGLAQLWATPGLVLLSVVIVIALAGLSTLEKSDEAANSLLGLALLAWIATSVTYIDSAMVIAVQVILISAALFFFPKKRTVARNFFRLFTVAGVLAGIAVAPYTWAALQTLTIRLRLAQGTGIDFRVWPLPSETMGLFDVWTGNPSLPRDPLILILSSTASAYLMWIVFRKLPGIVSQNLRTLAGIIVFTTSLLGVWTANTGLERNYVFVKVSTYLMPLFIILLAMRWSIMVEHKKKSEKIGFKGYGLTIPSVFLISTMLTAIPASLTMYQSAEYVVPSEQYSIYDDNDAQQELEDFNYLTTYRPISNLLGTLGNVHWVSKAPNDLDLSTRMKNEMRIICFASDVACKPSSQEIESALNKYGLRVFQSPITTAQFVNLSIIDRYNAATDAVGQERLQVPERFIGGNPLLKTDQ